MKASIYCDGSSTGKVGPGGWAYVIVFNGQIVSNSGNALVTTNNRMEMQAALEGLQEFVRQSFDGVTEVELVSDSQYTLNTAAGLYKSVKNLDIVGPLQVLYGAVKAKPRWVKGHSGDVYNEICDQLAKAARKKLGD